jgi:DNA-binding CsgD family transcriptional regulator
MNNPALTKKQATPSIDADSRTSVPRLVRKLVKQIETDASADPPFERGRQGGVILDVNVDGIRCLLVRLAAKADRPSFVLSPREREIARMVARGYPNKTIAGVLEISSWTVGTYLRRTFAKLGVGSRAAMVARLMQEGVLKEQDSG